MTYVVFSKPSCPQCDKAKNLLTQKGLAYEERIIDVGQPKVDGVTYVTAQELKALIPTAKSVPQILLDDAPIGGFTELQKLLA